MKLINWDDVGQQFSVILASGQLVCEDVENHTFFNHFKVYLVNEGVTENHIIEIVFDFFENRQYRELEVLLPYLLD